MRKYTSYLIICLLCCISCAKVEREGRTGGDDGKSEFAFSASDEIRAITMQTGERIYISTTAEGTANLYDISGNMIGNTTQFGKDGGFVTLPKERGVYILVVTTPNEKRNFKVYVL